MALSKWCIYTYDSRATSSVPRIQSASVKPASFRAATFRFLELVLLLGLSSGARPAAAQSGTEAASFLDIPVGAGPAALGSAYSARATDAYAPVWNPAGLGFLSETQVAAQHLAYLGSVHYEFLSFVQPLGKDAHQAIGGAAQYLGTGDISATDAFGRSLGTYSGHFAAYSLAYGRSLGDSFSLGLTAKLVDAKIGDFSAQAFAVDAGALAHLTNRLSMSGVVTNLGTDLKFVSEHDRLPLALRSGLAYQVANRWNLSLEGVYRNQGLWSGHTGVEWRPLDLLALRAGYKTDTLRGLGPVAGVTAGLGLCLWGQEFSYAWSPYDDLGTSQYFSLVLRFGEDKNKRRNLIHYQSIKRHRLVEDPSAGGNFADPDVPSVLELLGDGEKEKVVGL